MLGASGVDKSGGAAAGARVHIRFFDGTGGFAHPTHVNALEEPVGIKPERTGL